MNLPATLDDTRLDALRDAFDAAFARPPATPTEGQERLLLVVAGGQRYALRLAELGGLQPLRRLVPLPGGRRELLGLAGVRGRLVAVFDLARLLGAAAEPSPPVAPRWLLLCGGAEAQLALACGHCEGLRQLPQAALQTDSGAAAGPWACATVALDGQFCPLLDLPALLRSLGGTQPLSHPPE